MDFKFFPKIGLGAITFGMPREQVRVLLNADFVEFKRSIFAKNTTDAYNELGLHVDYDENNLCYEIEAFEPANIIFGKEKLLEVDLYEVLSFLKKHDSDLERNGDEITSKKLGIILLSNDAEEIGAKINSLVVFKSRLIF